MESIVIKYKNETSARTPSLFEDTAWYYSRYRPGYPKKVFEFLVDRAGLTAETMVLDIGAGTGQIAIPLAQRGIPVVAIDPDIQMLCEGICAEQRANTFGIAWMRGDDEMVRSLHIGPVKLCTMGASFHWIHRDRLLHVLDSLIVADGGVVILSVGSVWSGSGEVWSVIVKSVVIEFLGEHRRAGAGTYSHPKDRHEVVLARSTFSNVTKHNFTVDMEMTVDDIIGLQLSTSYASPRQLGDRVDEFKTVLRDRLLEANPAGVFIGKQETELLFAVR